MIKLNKIQAIVYSMLWILLAALYVETPIYAQYSGLTPENFDGFETADWRNFRPHYIGNSEEFIRPRFDVTDNHPISGRYSLRWSAGNEEHEWLMLSNAFFLGRPFSASVLFRTTEAADTWRAGFYMMQDYGFFSGIQVKSSGVAVQIDADEWGNTETEEKYLEPGRVYKLEISLDERNNFTASVTDQQSEERLFEQSGISAVQPGAIAMYIKTNADTDGTLMFDDVSVRSGDYYVESGKWTRAPQPYFVALPRYPDVTQEEGNWVGGHSVMKTEDGEYLMWYRIRDNIQRGKGYGFATSSDGLTWHKYDKNPVFVPDNRYASNEKIAVLKIDGVFRGWYTVERDGLWITKHIESRDGVEWENDEAVIDERLCKDADVVYLDEAYFLYCIGPTYTDISVYTSDDGLQWELREVYEMGTHRHLAAYYETKNSRFALYPTAGGKGVSYAVSDDGIRFGSFVQTWTPPSVGLDDWSEAGITYLSFLRNEHGHIWHEKSLPVYYQARNTYDNNIPGWLYHGGERVVLAGKFDGLFQGVPTQLLPDGSLRYRTFPFKSQKADGLVISSDRYADLLIDTLEFSGQKTVYASGYLETGENSLIQIEIHYLDSGDQYELRVNGTEAKKAVADSSGIVIFRHIIKSNERLTFTIQKLDDPW